MVTNKEEDGDLPQAESRKEFRLVVNPMTDEKGRPLVKPKHVVDAGIVASITFFSLLIGTSLPEILFGSGAYVTATTVSDRIMTAGLAFGLTFFAQWARYRGVLILKFFGEE